MSNNLQNTCTNCTIINCRKQDKKYPKFCPNLKINEKELEDIKKLYKNSENQKIAKISSEIEADFYCKYTRIEETIEFAKRMNFKKIGIATCVGLLKESRILAKILKKKGFEIYTISCKIGTLEKTEIINLNEDKTKTTGNIMCNPILQAKILNKEKTDLNIVIGLCVGHDSLFYKYSNSLTTTLITKDRVLAHNPCVALYQTDSYYSHLLD